MAIVTMMTKNIMLHIWCEASCGEPKRGVHFLPRQYIPVARNEFCYISCPSNPFLWQEMHSAIKPLLSIALGHCTAWLGGNWVSTIQQSAFLATAICWRVARLAQFFALCIVHPQVLGGASGLHKPTCTASLHHVPVAPFLAMLEGHKACFELYQITVTPSAKAHFLQ